MILLLFYITGKLATAKRKIAVDNSPILNIYLNIVKDIQNLKSARFRRRQLFIKIYTITEAPLNEGERIPENLEKRAYYMTNKLIETILSDPQFKNAFLKAAAKMAAKK